MEQNLKKYLGGGAIGVAVAGAAVLGISYFMGADKQAEFIPADSEFVMEFNAAEIAENGGFMSQDFKDDLESFVKKVSDGDKEASKKLKEFEEYLDHPEKIGVRLDKSAYVWGSIDEKCVGFSVAMFDSENFENLFKDLLDGADIKFKEKDGMKWLDVDDDNVTMCMNDDYLLFVAGDNAKKTAKKWMDLDSDKKYVNTERYSKLKDADGQVRVDLHFTDETLKNLGSLDREFKQILAQVDVDFKSLGLISALNVQAGKVSATVKPYSLDDDMAKKLTDNRGARTIAGDYASKVPSDYVAWMGANINGEELAEVISEVLADADMDDVQKAMKDFKKTFGTDMLDYVKRVDGDLSFYASNINEELENSEFTFYAGMKDDSFFDDIIKQLRKNDLMGDDEVVEKGKHCYAAMDYEYDMYTYWEQGIEDPERDHEFAYFGSKDNTLYISNTEKAAKPGKSTGTLDAYMSDIKNSYVYMLLDLQNLAKVFKNSDDAELAMGAKILSLFTDFIARLDQDNTLEVSVNFTDQKDTIASLIFKVIDIVIEMQEARSSAYDYDDDDDYDYVDYDTAVVADDDYYYEDLDSVAEWED